MGKHGTTLLTRGCVYPATCRKVKVTVVVGNSRIIVKANN